jgi:hypothetical protein
MARKTFRTYARELSPPVLQDDAGGERFVAGAIGMTFDLLAAWAVAAVKAKLLTNPEQPTDALSLIGTERLSPRYAADTEETYRARLLDAPHRFAQAGSEQAMLAELAAAGIAATFVYDPDWSWDGDDYWSRFWLVVADHSWTGPRELGDGSILDGTWTLGSSATPEQVDTIRKIVRRWKPLEWICSHVIIVFDETTWAAEQPNGTWEDPSLRSSAGCYWPG